MAAARDSAFLRAVLAAHPRQFGAAMERAPELRFQARAPPSLPRPAGRRGGEPELLRHGFRADEEYFYPASSIKICAAIAALQELSRLQTSLGVELSPTTPLTVLPLFSSYPDAQDKDPSNLNGGAITVSDNQAYNRLYALVGQKRLNQAMYALLSLWDAGLSSVRLRHRLSVPLTAEENHFCEPLEISVEQQAFSIPPKHNLAELPPNRHLLGTLVGKAYVKDGSQLVKKPMDFSVKNVASLVDIQDLLVKLMRSDIHPGSPGLLLSSGQRQLLQDAMLQYPSQSHSPRYSAKEFPDDYCKFFLPGLCKVRPKAALRVYNKVGQAYGFTVDNSYVFDVETGRSFFMSMSIYTNANGVLDDDKYEYDTALRLAADLGEVIARAIWQIISGELWHGWPDIEQNKERLTS
eukprot:SM000206S06293  [mRNA]  locus=s206:158251:161289:- [translate_table: standard]